MADVALTPPVLAGVEVVPKDRTKRSTRVAKAVSGRRGRVFVWLIAALWTVPTFGLFLSSFRHESEIKTSGWWNWFTNPSFTLKNYKGVLDNKVGGKPFRD